MTNQAAFSTGLVVLAVGASLLATPAQAQKAGTTYRLGWLEVCGPGPQRPYLAIFRARLAEQGYVEGKNLVIEQRFADCHYERMARLAAELTQIPVDVLFTIGTRATRIIAAAVKSTPVVTYSCDPFVHVSRLARPGGNVTGVTCMTSELMPKRLEILKELVPTTKRVTFLQDPEAATNALELTQEVAKRLGVQLRSAEMTAAEELEPELRRSRRTAPMACWCIPTWFSALIRGLGSSATLPSRPEYPRCTRSASTWKPAV